MAGKLPGVDSYQVQQRTHTGADHQSASVAEYDWSDRSNQGQPDEEPALGRRGHQRLAWLTGILILAGLSIALPPLLNINRYQHRIAQAISQSIGRPVHFDSITAHLLPWPGFTLQNFVVQENPGFGAEPALRANVVEARLRVRSLWKRRVEFARIRLQAPSINLVRRSDGLWNLQSIVTQASTVQNAPTGQRHAGPAPRFPYMEATGARINLKLDQDKLPYSLVDTDFALWLPSEREWHLRLAGRPLRTDTDVSDVGQLHVEGTLGRGAPGAALAPLELRADWKPTPMGEAAKLFTGQDRGWRGEASAEALVQGTPAQMRIVSDLHVHNLRRERFVPAEELQLNAHCEMQAMGVLHRVQNLRCTVPTRPGASLLQSMGIGAVPSSGTLPEDAINLTADIPNVLAMQSAALRLEMKDGSPDVPLRWMRLFSERIPSTFHPAGHVGFWLQRDPAGVGNSWHGVALCHCVLPDGPAPDSEESKVSRGHPAKMVPQDAATEQARSSPRETHWLLVAERLGQPAEHSGFELAASEEDPWTGPVPLDLGPLRRNEVHPDPAFSAIGHIDDSGYNMQYGSAALAAFAGHFLPALQDGLDSAMTGAVRSERQWNGVQSWTAMAAAKPARRPSRHR